MVGARVGDDAVPDDSLIGVVARRGPFRRDVDEKLLRVPGEKRGEVGVEREPDDGVLLLLGAVVVGTALDSEAFRGQHLSEVSNGASSFREAPP